MTPTTRLAHTSVAAPSTPRARTERDAHTSVRERPASVARCKSTDHTLICLQERLLKSLLTSFAQEASQMAPSTPKSSTMEGLSPLAASACDALNQASWRAQVERL